MDAPCPGRLAPAAIALIPEAAGHSVPARHVNKMSLPNPANVDLAMNQLGINGLDLRPEGIGEDDEYRVALRTVLDAQNTISSGEFGLNNQPQRNAQISES
jgi:hypothetical protein